MRPLTVKLAPDFSLDAGAWEEVADAGTARRVTPPGVPMFSQLLDCYLRRRLPRALGDAATPAEEAAAATAACLRWGSYLAALANEELPACRGKLAPGTCLITGPELSRINTEASAGLARWLELKLATPHIYAYYVRGALTLPMPCDVPVAASGCEFAEAVRAAGGGCATRPGAGKARHVTRALANALINRCWLGNGVVEELHAGRVEHTPLTVRRLTGREVRLLMSATSERLAAAFEALNAVLGGSDGRPWGERLLPLVSLRGGCLFPPDGWSLTDSSAELTLTGAEPGPPGGRARDRASKI